MPLCYRDLSFRPTWTGPAAAFPVRQPPCRTGRPATRPSLGTSRSPGRIPVNSTLSIWTWEGDVTAEATVRSESDRQGNHGTGLWPVGMTGGRRIRIVPIESLSVGDSPRSAGEDANHTRLLAGIQQKLPPIVVHSATMRVIDGMHRLSVARQRGDTMI